MSFILFGPPGSGKGTQAKLLSKDLKVKHISTGEIFRKEYKERTKLGIKAHEYWSKGNLCTDEITNKLIIDNLPKENYLLDGYPRNLSQAILLDKANKPDFVIVLDVPYHILKLRLLKRAKIEGRSDDNPETIMNRFKIHRKQTQPLLSYYKNKIVLVDGDQKVEDIEKDIIKGIKNANRSSKIKP